MKKIQTFDGFIGADGIETKSVFFEDRATTGLEFSVDTQEGFATVVSYDGKAKHVYIPDYWGGYAVTNIGENAFYDTRIKSVRMPKYLAFVGAGAFQKTNLAEVDLGEYIEELGGNAFSDCPDLTKVTIRTKDCPIRNIGSFGYYSGKSLYRPAEVNNQSAWEQFIYTFAFADNIIFENVNVSAADKAVGDKNGNDIVDTYATKNGTYPDMRVGTANKAGATDFTDGSFTEYSNEENHSLTAGTYQFKAIYDGTRATSLMVYFDGIHRTNQYALCNLFNQNSVYSYDSVFFVDIDTSGDLLCSYLSVNGGTTPTATSSIFYRKIN